jgi:uncharacterized membrane protein YdbT with pleckstrin-like domain
MAIADNLIANESIEFQSKKHWMAPIRASGLFILLLLGFALIRWLSPTGEGFWGTIGGLMDLIAWGLLIAGVVGIIYNIIGWRTAEFAVTNLRVIREEGLLKHKSSASLISSITDVQSKVGVLGRSLGYGDLVIMSQSGQAGADRLMTITKTEGFRNAIMARKMSGSTAPAPAGAAAAPTTLAAPPAAPTSTAPDAAAALSSLADLRDRGAITAEEYETKKAEILARM